MNEQPEALQPQQLEAPKKRQRRQGSHEVTNARVREVAVALLEGVPGFDINRWVRQREADQASAFFVAADRQPLSGEMVRIYVKKAKALIVKTFRERREVLPMNLGKREILFKKAMEGENYRLALEIIQDTDELLGHYAPKKSEHTGPDGQALPSLSAVVLAIIQAEAKANGEHEQRGIQTDGERGAQVPPRLSTLLQAPLQDPGE
jgi:hypothetical protein